MSIINYLCKYCTDSQVNQVKKEIIEEIEKNYITVVHCNDCDNCKSELQLTLNEIKELSKCFDIRAYNNCQGIIFNHSCNKGSYTVAKIKSEYMYFSQGQVLDDVTFLSQLQNGVLINFFGEDILEGNWLSNKISEKYQLKKMYENTRTIKPIFCYLVYDLVNDYPLIKPASKSN
jgi:hypothetical protein